MDAWVRGVMDALVMEFEAADSVLFLEVHTTNHDGRWPLEVTDITADTVLEANELEAVEGGGWRRTGRIVRIPVAHITAWVQIDGHLEIES